MAHSRAKYAAPRYRSKDYTHGSRKTVQVRAASVFPSGVRHHVVDVDPCIRRRSQSGRAAFERGPLPPPGRPAARNAGSRFCTVRSALFSFSFGPTLAGIIVTALVLAVLMILALTFGVVGWTIVLTWIYNNTTSLFWIILLHGYGAMVQSYLVLSSNNYMAPVAYGILPWVLAAYVLKQYGAETLARPATVEPASS